ncbi:hypothetical protein [Hymenobacter coccineus]|uniref:OMP85-like membrane spanning beta-barrel domain-containing protein n=1 Tax=Hymenobacter coccineus TaxID=1908235 RepID=A0A1G1THZ8_9BACT|nr:hypothetical protein [Hymenobacter coccineus]OGX90509.1 hypothetical protein BEN49_22520 [Hymenobacter coccineus]
MVGRFIAQAEQVSITTYTADFAKAGLYTQRYATASAQLMRLLGRNRALGVGTRYEYGRFQPEITAQLQLDGHIHLLNNYLTFEENTLNAVSYPTRDRRTEVELGVVYRQRPSFRLLSDTTLLGTENSPLFSFQPYGHYKLNLEQFLPLAPRATLLLQAQAGLNWRYRQAIANDFVVGGLSTVLRNQITFAGLPETGVYTNSAVAALVGYRYGLSPKVSVTAKANALYHSFLRENFNSQPAKLIYGGTLTLGINSLLCPIDASLMYSNVSKRIIPYFNIGIPFGYR